MKIFRINVMVIIMIIIDSLIYNEQEEIYFLADKKTSCLFYVLFFGSLVSKDGRSGFHESLYLHPPTAGLCPKTLHLDLLIPLPEGDSIQVIPAVSFWKRKRYRLSYQGRAFLRTM